MHLGSQISALADGQLPPAAAERVMAHVAACGGCAAELAAARAARKLLAAAFDVPVTPELTQRLLALGSGPGSQRAAGQPTVPVSSSLGARSIPLPGTRAARRMPTDCLHGDLQDAHRTQSRLAVAALAGVGVLAAALFAVGEPPTVVPVSHPAQALTVLGRAGDTAAGEQVAPTQGAPARAAFQQVALPWRPAAQEVTDSTDTSSFGLPSVTIDLSGQDSDEVVADWMRGHGWTPMEELPDGYRVTALRADAGGRLELDLDGAAGLIVVTQEHGRLDPTVSGRLMTVDEDGAAIHVLSAEPWHGVWQSGDTVVSVLAGVPSDALGTVLESYPVRASDTGVAARIARGWDRVAGTWRP